ncbi:MAG: hypothetical protein MN733_27485 [Nitrososphaera sp.]|nr:hypothetical protein [Nitrososphaera sp.]
MSMILVHCFFTATNLSNTFGCFLAAYESRADLYDQLGRADLASKDRIEAKRLNSKPAERPIYELKEPLFA